jgi:hypothetical protein
VPLRSLGMCFGMCCPVCRSLTGINGSSEGIVGVLVRGDTATALNISLGSVQVSWLLFTSSARVQHSFHTLQHACSALPSTTQRRLLC